MYKPACKQCLELDFPGRDGTENVVRFMGTWACRIHFKIQNEKTGENEWSLGDLFPNRQWRRAIQRKARGGIPAKA